MSSAWLKSEKEWLNKRKQVVTATESPILLGLNKWMSPNKMLQEKENSTFFGNAYTIIGQWLEPVVIQAVNKVMNTNFQIIEGDQGKLFYERSDVKLGATPDASEGRIFLECKTTKPVNYYKYDMNPPEYYIMQLMTQLYCADYDIGYLAIMSTDLSQDSPELRLPLSIFKVTRSEELCKLLKSEVERFWESRKEGKMFRVNSKVKSKARLLVTTSYIKVF